MPTDIYTLGIEVDSTDVKSASTNLDDLATSATAAGVATEKASKKTKPLADGLGGGGGLAPKTKKANKELQTLIGSLRQKAETLGFTEQQLSIYQAKRLGATNADLKAIDSQYDLISAYNAEQLALKKVNSGLAASAINAGRAGTQVNGLGRNAGMAGIQVQQFVGQIQGGQSAMVALSQQSADLGFVLGAPLVGVVVSLGAVLVGTLMAAFSGSADALKELTDELDIFGDELESVSQQVRALAAEQKKLEIEEQQKVVNKINKEYEAQSETLTELRQLYRDRVNLVQDESTATGELATDLAGVDAERQKETNSLERLQEEYAILTGQRNAESEAELKARAARSSSLQDQLNQRRFVGQEELEILRAIGDAEAAALTQDYSERIAANYAAYAVIREDSRIAELEGEQELLTSMASLYGEYYDSRSQSDIDAAKRASKERERVEEATQENILTIDKSFNSIFTNLMDSQSKDLFEIGKIGAASKASFDAYGAINATLAQGGAFAAPAAWAIGAAAFLNVSKILGTKYGGTGGGVGGAPNIPEPQQQVSNENTQNVQNTFNITGGNSESIAGQIQELFDSGSLSFRNGSVVSA